MNKYLSKSSCQNMREREREWMDARVCVYVIQSKRLTMTTIPSCMCSMQTVELKRPIYIILISTWLNLSINSQQQQQQRVDFATQKHMIMNFIQKFHSFFSIESFLSFLLTFRFNFLSHSRQKRFFIFVIPLRESSSANNERKKKSLWCQ